MGEFSERPISAHLSIEEKSSNVLNLYLKTFFRETLPDTNTKTRLPSNVITKGSHVKIPVYDMLSGMNFEIFSLFLNLLLPPSAMHDPQSWHMELWEILVNAPQEAEFFIQLNRSVPLVENSIKQIITGSRIENLNLPLFVKMGDDGQISAVHQSDLDILFSIGKLDNDKTWPLRNVNQQPGYMFYPGPEKKHVDVLHDYLQEHKLISAGMNGPALTGNKPLISWDFVVCLEHPDWPMEAEEWIKRKRYHNWPSEHLIDDIEESGCHLIPKSYPVTENMFHDQEKTSRINTHSNHRFSFSVAEAKLAKSLNDVHRQCYFLLRIIFFIEFREPVVLKTYHLKTILFWVCENLEDDIWRKRNISWILLYMLDYLLYCLSKGNLPHYFIPRNNLFSCIHKDVLKYLAKICVAVRRQPWECLLKFARSYRIIATPFTDTTEKVLRFFLSEARCDIERLPGRSSSGILLEPIITLATAYISCAPTTEKIARDFLHCTTDPKNLRHCILMTHCYKRRIIKPFLCVVDILGSEEENNNFFSVFSTMCFRFYNSLENLKDSKGDVHESFERILEGRADHDLEDFAQRTLNILPSVSPLERLIQEICTNTESIWSINVAQYIFSIYFALYIIISFHISHQTAAKMMKMLLLVIQLLEKYHAPSIYIKCAKGLQAELYLKNNLIAEVRVFLKLNLNEGNENETDLPDAKEQLPEANPNPNTMSKLTDDPSQLLGRLYPVDKHDLVDNDIAEISQSLLVIDRISESNVLKNYLIQSTMNKVSSPPEGAPSSNQIYKLTYACQLFLSQKPENVKDLVDEILQDNTTRIYFLNSFFVERLFKRSLTAYHDLNFTTKVPVFTRILALFLKAKVIYEHSRATSKSDISKVVKEMNAICTCLFHRGERACRYWWESIANSLTLTGYLYQLTGDLNGCLVTSSAAAAALYMKANDKPSLHTLKLNHTGSPSAHLSSDEALWFCLRRHWGGINLRQSIRILSEHFYPGISKRQALCSKLSLLFKSPVAVPDMAEFLAQIKPEEDNFPDILDFMSFFLGTLSIAFPRLGPQHRIQKYFQQLEPHLKPIDAFYRIISDSTANYRDMVVAFMITLSEEFYDFNTVLDPFLLCFYEGLSPENSVKDVLSRLYPGVGHLGEAVNLLFTSYNCPGVDYITRIKPLHCDPLQALLLALHIP